VVAVFGVKKAIERIGVALRGAFVLEEHPIRSYSKTTREWEARFLTGAGTREGGAG
jgi:hypothetical protein